MVQRQFGCECSVPLMCFSPWCMMHDRQVFLSSCATHCHPAVWIWLFVSVVFVVCRDAFCVARFMPSAMVVAIWVILVFSPVIFIFSGFGGGVGWGSVWVV